MVDTNSWTRAGAAILTATVGWETTAVVEPTIMHEGGVWKMWYRGGWSPAGIGYATCTGDPTHAANWTKYAGNPVIGGTAQQPTVIKVGSTYYIYYAVSGGAWKVATSSDGISWGSASTALATTGAISQWANSAVWVENGNEWHALLEGFNASNHWEIHLLTSSDGITWTQANGSNPLTSLRIHVNGAYGGPNVSKSGSVYDVWYHAVNAAANLPTDIYHAHSTDLINWTQYTYSPSLVHTGSGFEIDQVADPDEIQVYDIAYLFYDGDDNNNSTASIGVATFAVPADAFYHVGTTGLRIAL